MSRSNITRHTKTVWIDSPACISLLSPLLALRYGIKMGVILAVMIGITALKIITTKRKEFFREAGSGYNVNAYTCAINVVATLETSIQIIIAAMFALWLRNSMSTWTSFFVNFLALGWITTSWALLFPLVVPAENVFTVAGFYFVLFSLLFSGGIAPVMYGSESRGSKL